MPHYRSRPNGLAVGRVAIDQLENRTLLSNTTTELVQEPITIGVPSLKDITFVATNGRKTNISVSGATASIAFPGPAALTLYKGHAFFPAGAVETVGSIVIANAIPGKASLKVVCAYGSGSFDIGSITGGNLGSIVAPDVNLTGSMTLMSVNKLTLASVSGATMNLGSSVGNAKLTGVFTGSLTAGNIGSLKAFELVQANITTTDLFSRSKLQIGLIDGGAGIEQSNIISAGNIGTIKSAFIENSVITAAAHPPATPAGQYPSAGVPEIVTTFSQLALIKASRNQSSKTTTGFFGSSVIAADSITSLQLGELSGGGGVASEVIGSFNGIAPSGQLNRVTIQLNHGQLRTPAKLRSALAGLGVQYASAAGFPENTVFYNFNLNILS